MADDILDEFNDDLDDPMEDMLDDALDETLEDTLDDSFDSDSDPESDLDFEDLADEPETEKKPSFLKKAVDRLKGAFQKIRSSKKLMIITGAGSLLLLLLGVGILFLVLGGSQEEPPEEQIQVSSSQMVSELEKEIIFEDIVELEPFERIPLKGTSSMEFISITLALELVDHRYRKQVYSMEERIRKMIAEQVAQATWLELRTPEGKIMLKYELLKRMNSIFPKPTVRNVYFTYFVMQ